MALNGHQEIVAVFSGALEQEHRAACAYVRANAMVRVGSRYDVVVTTNSGYPLDQNLYQCVKGLRAAAAVVRDGGVIILTAACEDGLPAHGRNADLLATSRGPEEFLRRLADGEIRDRDQWQVQVQAEVQAARRFCPWQLSLAAMPNRPAAPLVIDDTEREALRALVRAQTTEQRLAMPARVVLAAADGVANARIAEDLGVHRVTVLLWRARFARERLAGLAAAPRPGRVPTYGADSTGFGHLMPPGNGHPVPRVLATPR